jgi:hypothetical protein
MRNNKGGVNRRQQEKRNITNWQWMVKLREITRTKFFVSSNHGIGVNFPWNVIIIISLIMPPLLGHRPSLWIPQGERAIIHHAGPLRIGGANDCKACTNDLTCLPKHDDWPMLLSVAWMALIIPTLKDKRLSSIG